MKLCSRRFVLYCRYCRKDDKFRYFIPHFKKARGGVEPWLMARWKARERLPIRRNWTFSLALTVQALQGKMCQDSLLSGVGRSVRVKISRGRFHLWGIFFGFYKTRYILLSDSANCTMLRAIVLTQYRRVTDGQTDGIAVASTALAKQRTVKNVCRIWGIVGWLIMGKLDVIHKTGST